MSRAKVVALRSVIAALLVLSVVVEVLFLVGGTSFLANLYRSPAELIAPWLVALAATGFQVSLVFAFDLVGRLVADHALDRRAVRSADWIIRASAVATAALVSLSGLLSFTIWGHVDSAREVVFMALSFVLNSLPALVFIALLVLMVVLRGLAVKAMALEGELDEVI